MCSFLFEGNDVKFKFCFVIVCIIELGRMNFEMYFMIMCL